MRADQVIRKLLNRVCQKSSLALVAQKQCDAWGECGVDVQFPHPLSCGIQAVAHNNLLDAKIAPPLIRQRAFSN